MTKSIEKGSMGQDQAAEQTQEQPRNDGPRPKAELPEIMQWQTKMRRGEDGKAFTSDVKAPDGTHHRLKEGENFVITRGEGGDYEAAIVGADGEKTILRESLASKKAKLEKEDKEKIEEHRKYLEGVFQEEREKEAKGVFDTYKSETSQKKETSEEAPETKQENEPPFDKERLNKIMGECSKKGASFGRDVNLDDEDRKQIEAANQFVEQTIDKAVENDGEWKKFKELKAELDSKGALLGFKFPPPWLIDGGENAGVLEKKGGKGEAQIVVPSKVYNAFYYKETVRQIRDGYVESSNNVIRGESAHHLSDRLKKLAYFVKETEGKKQ